MSRICLFIDKKVDFSLPEAGGTRNWRMISNGCRVSLGDDKHILKLDNGDDYTVL